MFLEVAGSLLSGSPPLQWQELVARPQSLAGSAGLYSRLDSLKVFRADPQRKKARILVQQLIRTGLVEVTDPDNLRPAIEYHLIRLYLRTGRVKHSSDVQFPEDRATDIRSVTALRNAVEQAMHYTAQAAGLSILQTNDIEWQVARSYCDRDAPRCAGPPREDKPVEWAPSADAGPCPFASSCDALHSFHHASLTEPRLSKKHAFY